MVLFPGAVRIERVMNNPERRASSGDVRCLARKIPCMGGGRRIVVAAKHRRRSQLRRQKLGRGDMPRPPVDDPRPGATTICNVSHSELVFNTIWMKFEEHQPGAPATGGVAQCEEHRPSLALRAGVHVLPAPGRSCGYALPRGFLAKQGGRG